MLSQQHRQFHRKNNHNFTKVPTISRQISPVVPDPLLEPNCTDSGIVYSVGCQTRPRNRAVFSLSQPPRVWCVHYYNRESFSSTAFSSSLVRLGLTGTSSSAVRPRRCRPNSGIQLRSRGSSSECIWQCRHDHDQFGRVGHLTKTDPAFYRD